MLTCSKRMKNSLLKTGLSIVILSVSMLSMTGCGIGGDNGQASNSDSQNLTLATTTAINDSGLLNYLSPIIKEDTGLNIKVIANEAEKAIKSGEAGEADVLLINDKALEDKFVSDGYGIKSREIASKYFVILGPENDPAGISSFKGTAAEALKKIADSKSAFYSAAKDSVLNKKEKSLWKANNMNPEGEWYKTSEYDTQTLIYTANNLNAYTLADNETYTSIKDNVILKVVMDTADDLNGRYVVLSVNPDKVKGVNKSAADTFAGWMSSQRAYKLINEYVK